jgi:hypothetical protein
MVERSGTLGLCHEDTQLQLLKELKEWAQRTKHRDSPSIFSDNARIAWTRTRS